MRLKSLSVLLLLCTIITACRIDSDAIIAPDEKLTVLIYKTGEIARKEIASKDYAYVQFIKWVKENDKGWSPSPVTFAPSVEIRGKKFVINFHPTRAILNFQGSDGSYHQYVKDIKEADFRYLIE